LKVIKHHEELTNLEVAIQQEVYSPPTN